MLWVPGTSMSAEKSCSLREAACAVYGRAAEAELLKHIYNKMLDMQLLGLVLALLSLVLW